MVNLNVFSQILSLIDRELFKNLVAKHKSDKHQKGINSWTHIVSMLFCHFSSADSLRDISNGLRSTTGTLNHLGVTRAPSKSNISYINKHQTQELFKDLYFSLLDKLWQKNTHFRKELGQLRRKVYLMDASIIPLCLSVFDWAKFRSTKGAVKLHTVLDYDGCLTVFMQITDGKVHESQRAGSYSFSKGSVVVVDRSYVDYNWLGDLDSNGCYFVTRSKINMRYKVIKSYQSEALLEHGVIKDELIELSGTACNKYSSKPLRLVDFWDSTTGNEYHFLTNNTRWKASLVANIYRQRWHIEVFFKHLKQRLKVSTFIGTSENAVMIQIWTSLIGILLLKYLQKKARYDWNLSNLVAFIRMNIFVKINIWQWIDDPFVRPPIKGKNGQLKIFPD